ncbi:uncharacterized protein LOC126748639 [Anthonomus grandis grandis]|uniref:uncharacterized protein LOC126748639 n=1 Tax=Anthonomus grandis grandis TaxID=2921223 RepID=UPI002165F84D|nr:uncharacterized protein LOC126748639 [Anthonomus grandis grandis]
MFGSFAFKFLVLVICLWNVCCEEQEPVYRYRYETQDMMKTSATSVPLKGYHVVEGNYYPAESGLIGHSSVGPVSLGGLGTVGGGKFIGPIGAPIGFAGQGAFIGGQEGIGYRGVEHIGYGGAHLPQGPIGIGGGLNGAGVGYTHHVAPQFISGSGVGPGIGAVGLVGGGGYVAPHVHGYGGEEVEKSHFGGEKKALADVKYEKAHGNEGHQLNHGQEGYSHGSQIVKDLKGEDGYYKNAAGGKNVAQDGKHYTGAQSYNQEGKNGEEKKLNNGHKKGHRIKGFKSSHHKDESGKTEEYYDEEHDEGNNFAFNGLNGAFGQSGESSFNGGHQDGKFNEEEQKKSGHISSQYGVNKEVSDQGKYGQNKYAGSGQTFGVNNGVDQQSLLGHQENSKFFKHHAVPFYHHY